MSSPQMFTSSVVENEKKFSGEVGLSGSGDRSVGDRGESSRCSPGLRGCGDDSLKSVCVRARVCVCVCVYVRVCVWKLTLASLSNGWLIYFVCVCVCVWKLTLASLSNDGQFTNHQYSSNFACLFVLIHVATADRR